MILWKIVKSLEESALLIKTLGKQLKINQNNKVLEFVGMFLGTLGAISLDNLWTGKGTSY